MFTLALVRFPPTATKEIQYLNAKGALTYTDIAGDPVLYGNLPPREISMKDVFRSGDSSKKFKIAEVFFQAEAAIRDLTVTGVQTCALPIWVRGCLANVMGPPMRGRPGRDRGHAPWGRTRWPRGWIRRRRAGAAILLGVSYAQCELPLGEIGRASCRERV